MAEEQLAQRVIAIGTEIDPSRLRMADIDEDEVWVSGKRYRSEWELIVDKTDVLTEAQGQLWIDDSTGITPLDMLSRAKRIKGESGLDLVIVDYLQLAKAMVTWRISA